MPTGSLAIVLHAHLPFIRHPEHDHFLEEDWLFEAVTETYLPLLSMCHNLARDGVPFRLTLSLTPPLLAMFSDPLLQQRYVRYLDRRIALMQKEIERTHSAPEQHATALEYAGLFARARALYCDRHGCDMVAAFREFQERGEIEILACPATHGFLPLMKTENAVRAQVAIGCEETARYFGRRPAGMWLPECAYLPGLEDALAPEGVRYFILDTHGVMKGRPSPAAGVHAPVACPNGVAVFARDEESSKQVWSADEGYPGDGVYREFYRDLGYDGDYEYVRPFLHPDGVRRNLGIKYHRVTGRVALDEKQYYDPQAARQKAREHAGHFAWAREKQCEWLANNVTADPIVVAPYDAELFGHWWFEGPEFLERLFRRLSEIPDQLRAVTLSEYLDQHPPSQVVQPAASSWGDKGYFQVWVNSANDWIYRHLHKAEERMIELASTSRSREAGAGALVRRALNQAARELLLAQSSDWAFLMSVGTAAPYAQRRTRDHVHRFTRLYEQITRGRVDQAGLEKMEQSDNIFPVIDFRLYL